MQQKAKQEPRCSICHDRSENIDPKKGHCSCGRPALKHFESLVAFETSPRVFESLKQQGLVGS